MLRNLLASLALVGVVFCGPAAQAAPTPLVELLQLEETRTAGLGDLSMAGWTYMR